MSETEADAFTAYWNHAAPEQAYQVWQAACAWQRTQCSADTTLITNCPRCGVASPCHAFGCADGIYDQPDGNNHDLAQS